MDINDFSVKRELDLLVRDFQTFTRIFRYLTVAVYAAYLLFRFLTHTGYTAVNIVLSVATVLYLGAVIVLDVRGRRDKDSAERLRLISRIYRYVKFAAAGFSSVVSVLGILTAVHTPTVFSVLLAILMPVCLVLQIVLDVFVVILTARIVRFKRALSADVEVLKRDMVKIVLGLVKNSLFGKGDKKKEPIAEADDEGLIVVGSDDPESVRLMRQVRDGGKGKGKGFFARLFNRKGGDGGQVEK